VIFTQHQSLHFTAQALQIKRFEQQAIQACLLKPQQIRLTHIGGQAQHRQAPNVGRIRLAHPMHGFDAIHHRHDHVNQHQVIGLASLQGLRGLGPVLAFIDHATGPVLLQHLFGQQAVDRVVVHHQKTQMGQIGAGHRFSHGLTARRGGLVAQRQPKPKRGPNAWLTVQAHVAMQHLHQPQ
jgi:hypothetical protein